MPTWYANARSSNALYGVNPQLLFGCRSSHLLTQAFIFLRIKFSMSLKLKDTALANGKNGILKSQRFLVFIY